MPMVPVTKRDVEASIKAPVKSLESKIDALGKQVATLITKVDALAKTVAKNK